jgi:hypothetical protein
MATKATDIDVSLFQVGRLEDSSTVSSQKIAWINYETNKRKLHIQTPVFVTETYGIPRQGPYYQTDRSRSFFKLPFCHERALHSDEMDYCAMEKFYNKLVEIDGHFSSEDFKVKLFGEKMASKYEYQPIVRHPEKDNDEEEEVPEDGIKRQSYRPPYTKVKLMLSNNENELPLFRLFDKKDDGTKEEIVLNSFSDATKHVRYMTKHRMILEVQKLYAMKTTSGGEKRKYGVTVKLVAAECTNRSEITNNRCVDLFDD